MVMMAEPLEKAIVAARQRQRSSGVAKPRVVHLTPQGRLLDNAVVERLAQEQGLVLLAGRYEGVDERLVSRVVDDEISIGDYVLSGGELAAMVVIDCVVRRIPGALGDAESASQDSFVDGLLDHPHYTRPETYEGMAVPPVLLSGNHADIARWRLKQALGRTWRRRPDVLAKRGMSAAESALLEEFKDSDDVKSDGIVNRMTSDFPLHSFTHSLLHAKRSGGNTWTSSNNSSRKRSSGSEKKFPISLRATRSSSA